MYTRGELRAVFFEGLATVPVGAALERSTSDAPPMRLSGTVPGS